MAKATRGPCCRFWITQRRALFYDLPCGSGDPSERLDASPAPPHPLAVLPWGLGYSWTALPLQASVWEQVVLCRTRADAATGERLRAVWIWMAPIWTKLAAHKER